MRESDLKGDEEEEEDHMDTFPWCWKRVEEEETKGGR